MCINQRLAPSALEIGDGIGIHYGGYRHLARHCPEHLNNTSCSIRHATPSLLYALGQRNAQLLHTMTGEKTQKKNR
jgi:hypothetical protein